MNTYEVEKSKVIYGKLIKLKYFEIKNNKEEFKSNIISLKKLLREENNYYEKLYAKELNKNLLFSEINLVNILKASVENDFDTLIKKRISNLLYSILDDQDTLIENVLRDDSIKFIIYILKEYNTDLYYNIKYDLAFVYPSILKYLLDNDFKILKDLYWYSYLFKDRYNISNEDFYQRRILYTLDELDVTNNLRKIVKNQNGIVNNDLISQNANILCKIVNRLILVLVHEHYENVSVWDCYNRLINVFPKATLKDAERILNFYNNDKKKLQIVRLIKSR